MKNLYLIRHGQSTSNVGETERGPDAELSDVGIQEAQKLADRCKRVNAQSIVSSSLLRAKQTAEIIGMATGLDVTYSELLVERRRPSMQIGARRDDPEVIKSNKLIADNFTVPGYRFSDEENFEDLKERGVRALEELKDTLVDDLLVVSHGKFLKVLIAIIMHDYKLTAFEMKVVLDKLRAANTGITHVTYEEGEWLIQTWNDRSHLG